MSLALVTQLVSLVGVVALWGAVGVLVYRDARDTPGRGRIYAVGWGLVALVFGVFGLLAYKASDWISFTRE